jgi:hypothetical protein
MLIIYIFDKNGVIMRLTRAIPHSKNKNGSRYDAAAIFFN